MKKNNKGFMLAEVVVTSTVLLTAMISLFFTFNKLYTKYETLKTYKDINGYYILDDIINYTLEQQEENNINTLLLEKENDDYKYIIKNKTCIIQERFNYFNDINTIYNIENLIIVNKTKEAIDNLKKENINNTFKDYLEYIKKYHLFNEYNKNSYLFIIEYKNKDTYNYSNMELR